MQLARGIVLVVAAWAVPAWGQDAEPPPPPDAFVAATAVAGPEATMEAACAAEDMKCTKRKLKTPKLAAPYTGLGLIERKGYATREHFLGIQTEKGWHLFELLAWGTDYGGTGSLKIKSVKLTDVVPGGAPELLVTGTRKTSNESSSYTRYGSTEELLWVCGVGDSGAPSCAEVLLAIDKKPSDMDEGATKYKLRLSYKLTADGKVKRKVKGKWPARAADSDGPLVRGDYENTRGFVFP
jgi:hypothetical protein